MFMSAVASVDDARLDDPCEKMRRSGSAVANDNEIRVQRFKITRGIAQGLAFFQRGGFSRKINDIRGEAQFGKFETDSRAGRRLNEQVNHRLAAQRWNLFYRAFPNGLERARRVQDRDDLVRAERFNVEEMFSIPGHAR
jgi:hypothetical protein